MNGKNMLSHKCPACVTLLTLEDLPRIGELVFCQLCGTTFEIVWLFPLELIPISVESTKKAERIPD